MFLRSSAGDDPQNALWVLDVERGVERLVADPRVLLGQRPDEMPVAERARRERTREAAGGFVAYDADPACTTAVAALGGRLFLVDLRGHEPVRELHAAEGAYDPRLSPTADHVAYVAGRALRVTGLGGDDHLLVGSDDDDVSWGSAEFVAAEEMERTRGHWWSPDGRRVAVARVDVSTVERWHVSDLADPGATPAVIRYPAAGTDNARVRLWLFDLDGGRTSVDWDDDRFPYLAQVDWSEQGLILSVQTRDQRTMDVLRVNPGSGATSRLWRQEDKDWVDIVPGTPAWLDGRLVTTENVDGALRLTVGGDPVTPPGMEVRGVVRPAGSSRGVVITASEDDPTVMHVHRAYADGRVERLTVGDGDGVHVALAASGGVVVVQSRSTERDGALVEVRNDMVVTTVRSYADTPLVRPSPAFYVVGKRDLRAAVLLPSDGTPDGPLPVLMDPYGGPHGQRVLRARSPFLTSQWLADQGFAVVVVDGRGTPGRGPEWEREVHGDLAGPILDDQVDALQALAAADDRLDLGRVAIRGWSFGGYLAALAVLRRPDVFHAAVAGAPVTDWSLYDTHYTERYLGLPQEAPDAYRRSSLLDDAARLERPLLLIHGVADDNVVFAHTLRLSRALLEAGRPHRVLPLSGITHMATDESVAENLLNLQVAFLREALGLEQAPAGV